MKDRVLSTGCPGLYLYAVKDSRVPPEIDLIYVSLSWLPIKSTCVPVVAVANAVCVCPSRHLDPVSAFQERRRAARIAQSWNRVYKFFAANKGTAFVIL